MFPLKSGKTEKQLTNSDCWSDCPAKKKKVKKQFFIYSIPPMSKPVGGRWKGDHDLEMLAFILISEETLDWFPFM